MKDRARLHQSFESPKPCFTPEVFKQALLARREAEVAARIQQIRQEAVAPASRASQNPERPASSPAEASSGVASVLEPAVDAPPSPQASLPGTVSLQLPSPEDKPQPDAALINSTAAESPPATLPKLINDKREEPVDGLKELSRCENAENLQRVENMLLAKQAARSEQLQVLRTKLDELAASKRNLTE